MSDIHPTYFKKLLSNLKVKPGMIMYGEIMDHQLHVCWEYTHLMHVVDFPLTFSMVGAFGYDGNLKQLAHSSCNSISWDKAICVADCHDSAVGTSYHFGDETDSILAACFLLARGIGIPLIFHTQVHHKAIIEGLKFFQQMNDAPFYVRDESDNNLLIIQRGTKGLAILNKSSDWKESDQLCMDGFEPGSYRELVYPKRTESWTSYYGRYDFEVKVERGGDGKCWISQWGTSGKGGFKVGPRCALFIVRN